MAKTASTQLQGLPTVSDEQLRQADEEVGQAQQSLNDANTEVDWLTGLHIQAGQWQQATSRIEDLRQQQEQAQALRDREEEIKAGAARWQELDRALSHVRAAIDTRDRLTEASRQADSRKRALQSVAEKLGQAEEAERASLTHLSEAQEAVQRLTGELSQVNQRIAELAPLVVSFEELERDERDLQLADEAIAAYPADLPERIGAAEQRVKLLEDAERSLPWLRQLANARSALGSALEDEEVAHNAATGLAGEIEGVERELGNLEDNRDQAADTERQFGDAVAEARTRHRDARERLRQFEQAAGRETCSLCGQAITPEHAEYERTRLRALVDEADQALADAEQRQMESQQRTKSLKAAVAKLEGQRNVLTQQHGEQLRALGLASSQIMQSLAQLTSSYRGLPERYRVTIAPTQPGDAAAWTATTYPTADELAGLEFDFAALPNQRQMHGDLLEQRRDLDRLIDRRTHLVSRIEERQAEFSRVEAKRARSEKSQCEERQNELQAETTTAMEQFEAARHAADVRKQEADVLRAEHRTHESALNEVTATIKALEERLGVDIAQSSPEWRETARTATAEDLAIWNAEQETLAEFPELARQLAGAHERLKGLERQIAEQTAAVDQLPMEARRPADEIEMELEDARELRDDRQANLQQRTSELLCRASDNNAPRSRRKSAKRTTAGICTPSWPTCSAGKVSSAS